MIQPEFQGFGIISFLNFSFYQNKETCFAEFTEFDKILLKKEKLI
jgi:hypothetical protein